MAIIGTLRTKFGWLLIGLLILALSAYLFKSVQGSKNNNKKKGVPQNIEPGKIPPGKEKVGKLFINTSYFIKEEIV